MITLAQLDQQKQDFLANLKSWPVEQLRFQPSPEAWSAVQILDHLVRTEGSILARAREGVSAPKRLGPRDRLGYLMVERVFRSERRVKVPDSAPQVLPDGNPDMGAIVDRWRITREDLGLFCGQISPEQARLGIFRHPITGWMDLSRILGFFHVHVVHHGYQLERLRSQSPS